MLFDSAKTVTMANQMALKQTINKYFKILKKLSNVLLHVYCKSGKFGLILS